MTRQQYNDLVADAMAHASKAQVSVRTAKTHEAMGMYRHAYEDMQRAFLALADSHKLVLTACQELEPTNATP